MTSCRAEWHKLCKIGCAKFVRNKLAALIASGQADGASTPKLFSMVIREVTSTAGAGDTDLLETDEVMPQQLACFLS